MVQDAVIHAGIVLAAGESSRMGRPKALLETPGGIPLAVHQVRLLEQAGCAEVIIVLGADRDLIEPDLGGCPRRYNGAWRKGRTGSVQCGLRALPGRDGFFILPVDTVGVSRETLLEMRHIAEQHRPPAVRPVYRGEEGKLVWISASVAKELLRIDPAREDARLDLMLRPITTLVDVDDPAILSNVNAPEDWEKWRMLL